MEYANNSIKNREAAPDLPEKKVEQVISGDVVKTRKKTGFQKFVSTFINEDVDDLKSWAVKDVIIPAVKRLIDDMVHGILYSGERRPTGNGDKRYYGNVSFTNYSKPQNQQPKPATSQSILDYDEVVLANRGDAELVLYHLQELVDQYGSASVGDLYDLVGRSHSFVYCKWGWSDLRNAQVVRVRDGYCIKLPRIISLS